MLTFTDHGLQEIDTLIVWDLPVEIDDRGVATWGDGIATPFDGPKYYTLQWGGALRMMAPDRGVVRAKSVGSFRWGLRSFWASGGEAILGAPAADVPVVPLADWSATYHASIVRFGYDAASSAAAPQACVRMTGRGRAELRVPPP